MTQPQPVKVDLVYPVEFDGRRIDALTMRPPMVRAVRDAQRGGGESADMEIRLFANLCEIEVAALEVLHARDYYRLQDVYGDFLAGGGGTGEPHLQHRAA